MAAIETSLANAFETQLTANVTDSDTTFPVGSIGSLTSPTYLVIDPDNPTKREYVLFDGTFTTSDLVTTSLANRGLAGSASGAQGHTKGAKVRAVPMQQHFEDLHDRMDTAYTVGGADVAVADGGTGASTAPVARTNLGAAADADVVHLAGAETISGAKTFSVDPTLADGSSALSLTEGNAAYLGRNGGFVYDVTSPTYGAVGDGVADDRAAIQAAIDAANTAGGGIVFLPEGTYLVGQSGTDPWCIDLGGKTGVTICGAGMGATLIQQATGIAASVRVFSTQSAAASYIAIESLEINGQRASQTVNEHRHGVFLHNASNVVLRDLHIHDMTGGGISHYTACTDIRIERCRIENVDRGCVEFTAGDTSRIVILNNHLTLPAGGTGQVIDSEVDASGTVQRADNVIIVGNYIAHGTDSSIAITASGRSDSLRNKGWIVANNTIVGRIYTIYSTGLRIVGNHITSSGTVIDMPSSTDGVLIQGNRIETTGTAAYAISSKWSTIQPEDNHIIGNHFICVEGGIELWGVGSTVVADNILEGAGAGTTIGVYLQATATPTDDNIIHGNLIKNFGQYGIVAFTSGSNTFDGLTITDNVFVDDQGTATMAIGLRLSGTASQFSNVYVADNVKDGGVTTLFEDPSTGGPVTVSPTFVRGPLQHTGTTVGFYGVTPAARAANPGTATGTDATVINNIVTALRNVGLVT